MYINVVTFYLSNGFRVLAPNMTPEDVTPLLSEDQFSVVEALVLPPDQPAVSSDSKGLELFAYDTVFIFSDTVYTVGFHREKVEGDDA
jgi:hypothetical protein